MDAFWVWFDRFAWALQHGRPLAEAVTAADAAVARWEAERLSRALDVAHGAGVANG